MRNHSYESKFDLHENEPVGRTHFHINGLVLIQFKFQVSVYSQLFKHNINLQE